MRGGALWWGPCLEVPCPFAPKLFSDVGCRLSIYATATHSGSMVCEALCTVQGLGQRDLHKTEPVPATRQLPTRWRRGTVPGPRRRVQKRGRCAEPHQCTRCMPPQEITLHTDVHRDLLEGFTNKGALSCSALQKDHSCKPREW